MYGMFQAARFPLMTASQALPANESGEGRVSVTMTFVYRPVSETIVPKNDVHSAAVEVISSQEPAVRKASFFGLPLYMVEE